jgi:hypothetical protein
MMTTRQISNKANPWYRTFLVPLYILMALTLSMAPGAVDISCAEESIDEAISNQEMGLFLIVADAMTFHEKISNARYYIFEPGNNLKDDSPSPVILPHHVKTTNDFQWLFNRFNRKSNGLIILPVLDSGVHISYKLDF